MLREFDDNMRRQTSRFEFSESSRRKVRDSHRLLMFLNMSGSSDVHGEKRTPAWRRFVSCRRVPAAVFASDEARRRSKTDKRWAVQKRTIVRQDKVGNRCAERSAGGSVRPISPSSYSTPATSRSCMLKAPNSWLFSSVTSSELIRQDCMISSDLAASMPGGTVMQPSFITLSTGSWMDKD